MQTAFDAFLKNLIVREKPKLETSRCWEVDMLRGVAIVLMVFYHLVWDLNYFGAVNVNMFSGPWQWFARSIATMFIGLVGVSLVLSYTHARRTGLFLKYLRRGAKIFGMGLIITVATYLFLGRGFVIFGILHLIGFSIAAAYPFLLFQRRYLSTGMH